MAYTTDKTLLARIKEGDSVSWHEFYTVYRPFILYRGQRSGLSAADCDELVQQVMLSFFQRNKNFEYQREKGTFRSYFGKVINNNIIDIIRKKRSDHVEYQESKDLRLDDALSREFENDWREYLFRQALLELKKQVEDDTFEAFNLYAMQGRKISEVSEFLEMSVSSIYVAKNRCINKLKIIINDLEGIDGEV
ncbi:MAG: RNA polymerase sigma factor [Chloroflexi bacterium ADurb.Bin344]|nr:MAG: RNA polymerase sigma factor [Chloroflexi bacterium ADurb.Bin344]